ncbi:c-type cytochrome [Thalassococcus sp. BH17M4-6]|uniref:c-type cytochrome n=1 Tax=Thalassococcus sp. BH17M4-6 TaxID=3413148 RepID=UPI003BC2AAC2
MPRPIRTAVVLACLAGAAFAHSGVTDPTVMQRMQLMKDIKDTAAQLGKMTRTLVPFDPDQAEALARDMARHAAAIPAAFETPAQDPRSEAKPEIWTDWPDFVADAAMLEDAASAMQTGTLDELRFGMRAVAKACATCHEDYRLEN